MKAVRRRVSSASPKRLPLRQRAGLLVIGVRGSGATPGTEAIVPAPSPEAARARSLEIGGNGSGGMAGAERSAPAPSVEVARVASLASPLLVADQRLLKDKQETREQKEQQSYATMMNLGLIDGNRDQVRYRGGTTEVSTATVGICELDEARFDAPCDVFEQDGGSNNDEF